MEKSNNPVNGLYGSKTAGLFDSPLEGTDFLDREGRMVLLGFFSATYASTKALALILAAAKKASTQDRQVAAVIFYIAIQLEEKLTGGSEASDSALKSLGLYDYVSDLCESCEEGDGKSFALRLAKATDERTRVLQSVGPEEPSP